MICDIFQIWSLRGPDRHDREIPLWYSLLQPCHSDALPDPYGALHHAAYTTAERQVSVDRREMLHNLSCWICFKKHKNTVWYRYNVINSLTNIHKRHPIARPLGRGMGCLLWACHLLDILLKFLQLFMQYLIILDHVITALDCIYKHRNIYPFPVISQSRDDTGTTNHSACTRTYLFIYPIKYIKKIYFHGV